MLATQLISRSGGWPMSVFLTPDLKPFYAGTYFPPEDRYGRPGFSNRGSPDPRLYSDSSDRFNASTVRARSLLASRAATGFISRIAPKSSPSPTW